jgi:hypothetical protein
MIQPFGDCQSDDQVNGRCFVSREAPIYLHTITMFPAACLPPSGHGIRMQADASAEESRVSIRAHD